MNGFDSLPLRGRAGVGAALATTEAPTPTLPQRGREEDIT